MISDINNEALMSRLNDFNESSTIEIGNTTITY